MDRRHCHHAAMPQRGLSYRTTLITRYIFTGCATVTIIIIKGMANIPSVHSAYNVHI